ncbi:MAG: DUF2953 domain-containing protein [Sporomusaceae bacterium]|nr:DUF2953 domain-containing protein [Sporomusaceae bacterium]
MQWLAVLGLLLTVFAVIWYMRVTILLRYHRRDGNDDLLIRIYAWRGLFSYVLQVPVIQVDWRDEMLRLESEIRHTDGDKRINRMVERHLIRNFAELLCRRPRRFQRIRNHWLNKLRQTSGFVRSLQGKIHCERFDCQLQFGLEDAAATAMLAGAGWLLQSLLVRGISGLSCCPSLTLAPRFGQNMLTVDLECIFRVRLGNIIYAFYQTDEGGSERV